MNKRTINRRPLKVLCDRCLLCFYCCLISPCQDRDQKMLSLMSWAGGSVTCFLPLSVAPTPNCTPSRNCQETFSSPLCHLPALWPWEKTSDPSQTPLEPMTPVCSWGEAIPSSLWHDHFLWRPSQSQPWFSFVSHRLLCWVSRKSLQLSMTYPIPVPKRTPGRSEERGEQDSNDHVLYECKKKMPMNIR